MKLNLNAILTRQPDGTWAVSGTATEQDAAPPPPSQQTAVAHVYEWRSLNRAGWVRFEYPNVQNGMNDPGYTRETSFGVPPDGWAQYNNAAALTVKDNQLHVSGKNVYGDALISGARFPKDAALYAGCTMSLPKQDGVWAGITFYCGEGNYREIGITYERGQFHAIMHTPRYVKMLQPLGTELAYKVAIAYHHKHGWNMNVNGIVVYTEAAGENNNLLQADPHVALFFVNLHAEGAGRAGDYAATVGPVLVTVTK